MKKILVVDDDKSIRLVLSTALTRSGFLVKTSATTAGFWGLLKADKFDVMITDVGLPDGDTLDVLPKIQTINPKMKEERSQRATAMSSAQARTRPREGDSTTDCK